MSAVARWGISAGLLAGGAVLLAPSVARYWVPCAGEPTAGGFSPACLAAMDQGDVFGLASPGPGDGWTVVAAIGLLALAWAVLVPRLPVSRGARLVAAVPAVLVGLTGVALALAASAGVLSVLLVATDVTAIVALVVLWGAGLVGAEWLRHAVVLGGATALGLGHQLVDYSIAQVAGGAVAWDTPPGMGWATVIGVALAALVTGGWTLLGARRRTAADRWDATSTALARG